MPKLIIGQNVQKLCQIFEPNQQNPSENAHRKLRSIIMMTYHLLFTVAVITMAVIFATIIEHGRKLNTFWKIWLKLFEMYEKLFVLEESISLKYWKFLSLEDKTFIVITCINVAVYLAWNVTRWKSIMLKYFVMNKDESNSIWSHLFSAFSHVSFSNLLINSVYLYSLCKSGFIRAEPSFNFSAHVMMEIEEFFVMYVSACVFCSLSRIYTEKKFNLSKNKHGASGAISAIFGYVAWTSPERQFRIPIVQTIIDIKVFQALLSLLMILIIIGFTSRWSNTNSINIITGCIFGIFWHKLGSKIIWGNRKYLKYLM